MFFCETPLLPARAGIIASKMLSPGAAGPDSAWLRPPSLSQPCRALPSRIAYSVHALQAARAALPAPSARRSSTQHRLHDSWRLRAHTIDRFGTIGFAGFLVDEEPA